MPTFIVCTFDDKKIVGGMEIRDEKIISYGVMSSMLQSIKQEGEYITSNFVYTLDSAPFWGNIIPALLSNNNYSYETTNALPKEVKSLKPMEIRL